MDSTRPASSAAPCSERLSRRKRLVYWLVMAGLVVAVLEGLCLVGLSLVSPKRAETYLRVGDYPDQRNVPDVVESDPALFWQLKANATAPTDRRYKMAGFIANSDRMRNEEVPVERGPNDFRVLCLGDSSTFGWGVAYEEAYPTVLRDLLQENLADRQVHVLNAGCPAYTSHQGYELLRRRGMKYEPDVVTVWFGWNDAGVWDHLTDREHASLGQPEGLLRLSAMHRLADYTLDRHLLKRLSRRRKADGHSVPRMPLDDYRDRLRDIAAAVRNASPGADGRPGRVVFILGCYNYQVAEAARRDGAFSRDDYQNSMLAVAAELDVPVLDVARELVQAGHGPEVFMDKGHPDARGQRVIAESLLALLLRRTVASPALLACATPR